MLNMNIIFICCIIMLQILIVYSIHLKILYKPITIYNFLFQYTSVKFNERGIEKNLKCIHRCFPISYNETLFLTSIKSSFTPGKITIKPSITIIKTKVPEINTPEPIENSYYKPYIVSMAAASNMFGCPHEKFECKYLGINEKEAKKYFNELYREVGKCGDNIYYITKKMISDLIATRSCCKANLSPAHIYNKQDLDCLIQKYNNLKGNKTNHRFSLNTFDYYLNKIYRKCPGGDLVNDELWAPGQPEACKMGSCTNFQVFVNLCSDCPTQGLIADVLPTYTWHLCIKETNLINRNAIFLKSKQYTPFTISGKAIFGGCPSRIFECPENDSPNSQKYYKSKYVELGKCGDYMYHITKKPITDWEAAESCCKANLKRSFIYSTSDLDCLVNLYNKFPGRGENTKFIIGAWDYEFNRVFKMCPGGDVIKDELWAEGKPEKCSVGTCTTPDTYVDLCEDCPNRGINDFNCPMLVHVLCMRPIVKSTFKKSDQPLQTSFYKVHVLSAKVVAGYIGCPEKVFKCDNTKSNKKDLDKYLNNTYKEVGKCGNQIYYVSKKQINDMETPMTCCKANLTAGFIYNKEDLDCLINRYHKLPNLKKITRFITSAWDYNFNRTFRKCPGGDVIKPELWAKGQPDNCQYGQCETGETFVDLCLNCSSRGMNAFKIPLYSYVLCMKDIRNVKQKNSKTENIYAKDIYNLLKFGGVSCKNLLKCSKPDEIASKFRNENMNIIGVCTNKKYYISKKEVTPFDSSLYCCKGNLMQPHISNLEELNCIRDNYKDKYGDISSLKAGTAHWDAYLNRSYNSCYNISVPEEIWAKGQPKKCDLGKCREFTAYLELCSNCPEFGLHSFFQDKSLFMLCYSQDLNLDTKN